MPSMPADGGDVLFEALTPVGHVVRVTRNRWLTIVKVKHPVMAGRELSVRDALESPDEVRQSRIDRQVLLFYKAEGSGRWTCAVVKRLGDTGFLIIAYPTDAI